MLGIHLHFKSNSSFLTCLEPGLISNSVKIDINIQKGHLEKMICVRIFQLIQCFRCLHYSIRISISGFPLIYEFNKSLANAIKKFFRNRVYTHESLDKPPALLRFSHVDGPFHNTLNIWEGKPVSPEIIITGLVFRNCFILLFTISEREMFFLHNRLLYEIQLKYNARMFGELRKQDLHLMIFSSF